MARKYTLKRRAEQKTETRRRIVEAAVELHGTVGPANTTLSMIAERAGVQRHTLYAHFPDERSIFMACSGHVIERDPLPDADAWRRQGRPQDRLAVGLRAIYDWFERNAGVVGCVTRDAEDHELTSEIVALRMGPAFAAYGEVLGAGLNRTQRAMLAVALGFHTWRTLRREALLTQDEAVTVMVAAVIGS